MIVEEKQTSVSKPRLLQVEDLKKHIKAIGEQIVEDADRMGIEPRLTKSVEIYARISPETEVTTVEWSIERIADPRVKVGK